MTVRVETLGETYRWKCPKCWREQSRPLRGEHPSFTEITEIKNNPTCDRCKRRSETDTEDTW